VHAAADTDHGHATERQQKVNELGTRVVMEAARATGIRKVVHLSTESVLATGKPLVNVDETLPLPRRFAGGYSRSKAAAERIALDCNAPEFPGVILRPRFVWGRDDTTALPALVDAARSGKFAWISGGNYLTSTTHIANLCVAIDRALTNGLGGEVYFISDGAPVAFRTFVSALLETQGLSVPEKSVPRGIVRTAAAIGDLLAGLSRGKIVPPLTLQSYATSAVEISLDISKARRELDYRPVISREQGLEELRTDQHW
jgi:nucleoside-diphosphate-sugar epimerase